MKDVFSKKKKKGGEGAQFKFLWTRSPKNSKIPSKQEEFDSEFLGMNALHTWVNGM